MQYDKIKDELPNYLLVGYHSNNYTKEYDPDQLHKVLLKGDIGQVESILASNSTWRSLTVFELPKEPILDFSVEALSTYREDLRKKENDRRQYELYLRLKAKFEPEELK
jgi:hypothetical protein